MANITVPIQVNLPDNWIEQVVERLRNDPESEWVEVVRCRDCKHHGYESNKYPYCGRIEYGYGWRDNDYCSRGERRENE